MDILMFLNGKEIIENHIDKDDTYLVSSFLLDIKISLGVHFNSLHNDSSISNFIEVDSPLYIRSIVGYVTPIFLARVYLLIFCSLHFDFIFNFNVNHLS